jgi:hypothetical protein
MWEFARCINMHQYTDADSFFDFNWYMTNDPRKYPKDYAKCTPIATDIDLKSAFHGMQETWLITSSLMPDETQYGTDPVTTYLDRTRWDVPGGNTCGDPIPTGLQVMHQTMHKKDPANAGDIEHTEATSTPDMICAKPGCTLVGQKCVQD